MNEKTPAVHGHRGARGCRPENTKSAITHGLQYANGVEVDLCITKDDVIVLHHNLYLNPNTTRGANDKWITKRKLIRNLSHKTLLQYDVGRLKPGTKYFKKFREQVPVDESRILDLDECANLIRCHARNDAVLNLELKSRKDRVGLSNSTLSRYANEREHFADVLAKKLPELRLPQQIFLQSFDWKLMELLKEKLERQKLNFKFGFTRRKLPTKERYIHAKLKEVKQKGGDFFSCHYRGVTAPMVKQAHDLGLEICAWTVNDEQDTKKLADWGVDIITTDYPDRCR